MRGIRGILKQCTLALVLGLWSILGFVHQYWYIRSRGSLCAGKASMGRQGKRFAHVSMILLNDLFGTCNAYY